MVTTQRHPLAVLLAVVAVLLSACGSADEPAGEAQTATSAESDHAEEPDDHDAEEGEDDSADHEDDSADHQDDSADDEDDHDDAASEGLGAHEHGAADLTVAVAGPDVVLELISPAQNVFGFEHEAVSDDDLATVADRTDVLKEGDVLAVNDEAGCSLSEPGSTQIVQDGSHSELTASWTYACDNPEEIAAIDASTLFAEFPNFEDVDVQWISDSAQGAGELSPSEDSLRLEA